MIERVPYSEAVEGGLIARLLSHPDQAAIVGGMLAAGDFYVEQFRKAYVQIKRFSDEHRTWDILTLQAALGDKDGDLQKYLDQVAGATALAPVEEYVAIIRRDAFRRRVIGAFEGLIRRTCTEESQETILGDLHDTVVEVSQGVEQGRLISPDKASKLYLDTLDRRKSSHYGLIYGFPSLDRILNPARGGDMIVVAARPSVGKSALAETIAETWARASEDPVLFASIEMNLPMILDRAVARATTLESTKIIRGALDHGGEDIARKVIEERANVGLWYLDDPYATTSSVRAAAAKVRILQGGLSAIIIDYLQLLSDAGEQEVQRVTKISRRIKALAREFDVPVIVLSQLNRAVEAREDQHPKLHDLRESGAIEQDADVVIGLHRPLGTSLMDLEILKQRQGATGIVHLNFDSARTRFSELGEAEAEGRSRIKMGIHEDWA